MEIIVKSDEIRNLGNQMINYSNELDAAIAKINDLADKISSAWYGEDATRYINVLQSRFSKGLDELREVLDDYGRYLLDVPQSYEILDTNYENKYIEV